MKPTVRLRNWYCRGTTLYGRGYGHPDIPDGTVWNIYDLEKLDLINMVAESPVAIFHLCGPEEKTLLNEPEESRPYIDPPYQSTPDSLPSYDSGDSSPSYDSGDSSSSSSGGYDGGGGDFSGGGASGDFGGSND